MHPVFFLLTSREWRASADCLSLPLCFICYLPRFWCWLHFQYIVLMHGGKFPGGSILLFESAVLARVHDRRVCSCADVAADSKQSTMVSLPGLQLRLPVIQIVRFTKSVIANLTAFARPFSASVRAESAWRAPELGGLHGRCAVHATNKIYSEPLPLVQKEKRIGQANLISVFVRVYVCDYAEA